MTMGRRQTQTSGLEMFDVARPFLVQLCHMFNERRFGEPSAWLTFALTTQGKNAGMTSSC